MTSASIRMHLRLARWLRAVSSLAIGLAVLVGAWAQAPKTPPLSRQMANTVMHRWPNGRLSAQDAPSWSYELGTLLEGMDAAWYDSADGRYYKYIKNSIDPLIGADGAISGYDAAANSLDNVLLGRQLLLLYRVTLDKRY